LIIAVIVYWNVHRKRKAARQEKVEAAIKDEENMKEAVKAMSLPIEPHATYLQTLMTLTNQTLTRNNNTATTKRPTARDIFSSLSESNAAYENTEIETKIEKINKSRFITKTASLDQSETATPESIARAVLTDIIDEMFVKNVTILETSDFEPVEIIDQDDVFEEPSIIVTPSTPKSITN